MNIEKIRAFEVKSKLYSNMVMFKFSDDYKKFTRSCQLEFDDTYEITEIYDVPESHKCLAVDGYVIVNKNIIQNIKETIKHVYNGKIKTGDKIEINMNHVFREYTLTKITGLAYEFKFTA